MLLLTPLAIRLGQRWGVVDAPGPRKIHESLIPLSGGWAILGTLSLVLWGHLVAAHIIGGTPLEARFPEQVRYFTAASPLLIAKVLPVYLGALGIFMLGLVDDLRAMSARSRLIFQILLAGAVAASGLRPQLAFVPEYVAILIGIVWLVGITNAFNFLDGLDGLSSGVALVGTLALLSVMGVAKQPDVVFFLAALAGTQAGFLRFNFHPARIFLGSSGSLLIGFLLACSTILVTYTKGSGSNWLMPLLTPVFVLAIPIYDTTSVILIRLLQKRPIAIGDRSHFHHRLLRLGFSHRQTVAFIIMIAFCVALSGVRLVDATIGQSLLILLQIVGIMSLLVIAETVGHRVLEHVAVGSRVTEQSIASNMPIEAAAGPILRETSSEARLYRGMRR
jgi:UDP-GlcNAc:undecaprenyl-phosphate GlcNAc-1-phosphate transferase